MFHRLALTSSLMLASALAPLAVGIALEPAALAQSVDVPFSGTVPVQATFSTPTAGTAETAEATVSGTAENTNTLESVTPATLSVQPSTPATITVSPPNLISGPTPDPAGTIRVGFLNFGSTSVRSDVGGGTANLPAENTALEVDMLVERPEPYPPGTYTYAVTVTITP